MSERKVFLDELPRWRYNKGQGKGVIDWKNSVGYKVKFIYDDIEGELEITKYDGKYLFIKYLNKNVCKITTSGFRYGRLSRILGIKIKEFKVEIGQNFKDEKRDLIILDREYRRCENNNQNVKYYKYKCNKCGWENGWIIESSLLRGIGCSCCYNRTVVEGINDIPTTAPWMVKYFQGGYDEAKLYSKCSTHKIYPICPDCGRIKSKKMSLNNLYRTHSIACSCGDGVSYPNKFMYSMLEQLNVVFDSEYCPNWIKPKRYDFYFKINDKSYIVEMDGGFHDKDNGISGQTKEESKVIDDYKDIKANEHDIEVIRIDSKQSEIDYIKNNIIKSKLNILFDLSQINWLKCAEFACCNLVKIACDIKKINPDLSIIKIGTILNLHPDTIRTYLKEGTKLGWCNYDIKEEKTRTSILACQKFKKQVICLDNGLIFNSARELEEVSIEIFGVFLEHRYISMVCNNRAKQAKGFHFKFVTAKSYDSPNKKVEDIEDERKRKRMVKNSS